MSTTTKFGRKAWRDRFNQPSVDQLRDDLEVESQQMFDDLRQRLQKIDGVQEQTTWYGDCWHWTVEYRINDHDEPLALLIPAFEDPQLGVPMDLKFVKSLRTRRFRRSLRDGLELAMEPFQTRWGVWSIQSGGLIEELESLVNLKMKYLGRAG